MSVHKYRRLLGTYTQRLLDDKLFDDAIGLHSVKQMQVYGDLQLVC